MELGGDSVGNGRTIKVLVVDDSIVFRELLTLGISSEPEIKVVATAKDPFEARDKILIYKPDVITCDVEMPKMNGIEFIRRLIPQYPVPVIVVSSVSGVVFDALNAGAVDFVEKPNMGDVTNVKQFIYSLIEKIKVASNAKIVQNTVKSSMQPEGTSEAFDSRKIIAIGASTGGTEAIAKILKGMPPTIPGIVIVQHIPPVFSRLFAERLNSSTQLRVKEAETGDYVEQGKVLIAPGDKHMRIKKVANRYKVECFNGEKVNGHCPSVDVLFESVAKEAGKDAIGVILTGMGYDGAKGLLAMKRKGAYTIGQDEHSSVVYGMPKVAYNIGAVTRQLSLERIAASIMEMVR
ncbi:chemotaxis response regulator protein-glutamate methylesterase 2 [Thermoclostridium stercorarium subsp. stercorarium DSM 8532]|uniref:Protein-glutamate methylesterase/protein-glutamine glutaminase n=1 Tax=Thermoclostridium stercorarium (strain ATCC 35414 / DSM 8532 / NCIMB 11754) TaxID=1121335 RepID=L7VKU3_THES1|nr:chemotaxis response regulator protein-glutamate methylesterase [Thermoclostridium stercorarium]AGC68750.1 chemotaxis response regulator protein-glutamate methylesterase 2 [Thermoclostridium stercorarium subsp. stercorarium DSM 8532]